MGTDGNGWERMRNETCLGVKIKKKFLASNPFKSVKIRAQVVDFVVDFLLPLMAV